MENRINKIRQIKNDANAKMALVKHAANMRDNTIAGSLLNNVAHDVYEEAHRELTLLIMVFALELNLYKRGMK